MVLPLSVIQIEKYRLFLTSLFFVQNKIAPYAIPAPFWSYKPVNCQGDGEKLC